MRPARTCDQGSVVDVVQFGPVPHHGGSVVDVVQLGPTPQPGGSVVDVVQFGAPQPGGIVVVVEVGIGTHKLSLQKPPGSHVPQSIGVPQRSSIKPHSAPSAEQDRGVQQVPNLSVGFTFTQIPLAQLRFDRQTGPSRLA
jgi:hypothetical protein